MISTFKKKSHLERMLGVCSYLKLYLWAPNCPLLRFKVVSIIALILAGKACTILMPMVYKLATDWLISYHTNPVIHISVIPLLCIAAYGGVRILSLIINQVRDTVFARVGQSAIRSIVNQTFQHIHQLSLRFHLQRHTGGLSRVIGRGTTGIESILRTLVLSCIPTILEFLLTIVVIAYIYNWYYVLVIGLTTVAYTWFTVAASNKRITIREELNSADTDAMAKAVDSLLNYETVKYFNNELFEAQRYDIATARYENAALRTYISLAWLNLGQGIIFTIGMALTMMMSAYEVMSKTQSTGHFIMINTFMFQLAIPLNFLGTIYREISRGVIDTLTMIELLQETPEVIEKPNARLLKDVSGTICFNNVTFAYETNKQILTSISFDIQAGEKVAIVGPSGSGKTTISRLLFRFYDVLSGAILIDGQDIRDIQLNSLRLTMGIVPQDTVLFNETIGYNLKYGNPTASQDEIKLAAQKAQISQFISSLPRGYDTEVGERGIKLSGGEKQRIAIARTILKNPPILILDEATSALDSCTERQIQLAMDDISKHRTTLMIAHRLSTVVNADNILVLNDGTIQEQGTHEDLLQRGGLYANMWEHQRATQIACKRLKELIPNSDIINELEFLI